MNIALIVAGGSGKRMGIDTPKQFIKVHDKPLLAYTVEAFNNHEYIDAIIIVCHEDYLHEVEGYIHHYALDKVISVIKGGETRQQSVFNGLKEIKNKGYLDEDIILIHDAARPMVNEDIITDNIDACYKYDAVVTAIASSDTVMQSKDNEKLSGFINRNEIYLEQTPASFKLKLIYKAHEKSERKDSTDDCQLVKDLGKDIYLVNGDKFNFKITTMDDLKIFEALKKEN